MTIELLPDTTGADLNVQGKYTISENWLGHTPEGRRSDRATVTITNDDDKPGISIAPASAQEGDSGSSSMTFTVTLANPATEPGNGQLCDLRRHGHRRTGLHRCKQRLGDHCRRQHHRRVLRVRDRG